MSNIKQWIWEEENSPSVEDMEEYELYCLYHNLKQRYDNTDVLEFFIPLMEDNNE